MQAPLLNACGACFFILMNVLFRKTHLFWGEIYRKTHLFEGRIYRKTHLFQEKVLYLQC